MQFPSPCAPVCGTWSARKTTNRMGTARVSRKYEITIFVNSTAVVEAQSDSQANFNYLLLFNFDQQIYMTHYISSCGCAFENQPPAPLIFILLFSTHLNTESKTNSTIVLAPAVRVLVRVGPQEIA